jgi:hypothetical protein
MGWAWFSKPLLSTTQPPLQVQVTDYTNSLGFIGQVLFSMGFYWGFGQVQAVELSAECGNLIFVWSGIDWC